MLLKLTPLRFYLYTFFYLIFIGGLTAQVSDEAHKNNYKWFDEQIGLQNTDLYNGVRYVTQFRTLPNDFRFFKNDDYHLAKITFDQQPYYDIPIKYDLFQDEIVAKLQGSNGESIVYLNKFFISEFSFLDKTFVQLNSQSSNEPVQGFYELAVYNEPIELYIKYYKQKKEFIKQKSLYHKFSLKVSYLLKYEGQYYVVSSKSDIQKILPNFKKQINSFFQANKKIKKDNPTEFMKMLALNLNRYIRQTTTK